MNTFIQLTAFLVVVALSSSSIVKSPSAAANEDNFELLILHNNDMHARFEQTSQLSGTCTPADREAGKCYGGFPRVAYVVKEARRKAASGEGPPVLYLNAGDTYTGTAWFTIYKWKVAAEFINALQPDAVSLGNHELDNGVSGLTPFIENVTCPVLAANLNLTLVPELETEQNLRNSVLFDINGTKIAIIGYLTPDTKVLAVRNDVEYIEEVIAIKKEVAILKQQGIKIFIALGHSGFTKDLEIAEKVEDIDLVIGGHTNTFLWNGTTPDIENPEGPYPTLVKQRSGRLVPAVQAYAYTKYLGKLHLTFNSEGELVEFDGNPILLNNNIPQDPDVLTIVNKYRGDVLKVTEVIVGNTLVELDGHSCRLNECNMGNLIADAMIYKYASKYTKDGWTDAPVAIIQGGGIRTSIAHLSMPANVTKGDLLTVMPFDGMMVKVTIEGSDILKMLEHAVAEYRQKRALGQFLQLSGIRVEYDFSKRSGRRVINVLIRCGICKIPIYEPLNVTKTYKILMTSFLAMGGDGFSVFDGLPYEPLNYNELDATVTYFQMTSPVYTGVENRIIIHNMESLHNKKSSIDSSYNNAAFYQPSLSLFLLLLTIICNVHNLYI
ncbi:protein 5NUC-like isoform 1-T1 [Aphomia sociella]